MLAAPNSSRSTEELFTEYAATGDDRLRTIIIERHEKLIRSLARKFLRPGVPFEDLVQTAWIGLIRAVDRFDPSHCTRFSTYAVTCAVGEIKRYFRDKTWVLKVPRFLQELSALLPATEERLWHTLQRAPTIAEMAAELQVSEEDLLRATDLGHARSPVALDGVHPAADGASSFTISDTVGVRDERMENLGERSELEAALQHLNERERRILHLRYSQEATQQQVADDLGLSQMHISRLERKALARMRVAMGATSSRGADPAHGALLSSTHPQMAGVEQQYSP
jgi:RNA polymerase sigma-B factor